MSLSLEWVGTEDIDRVAMVRMLSYAPARSELAKYQAEIRAEPRSGPGDFLLATRDGEDVGTASQLPLAMWVRGGAITCQGVAYVGTIKTARRRATAGESGVGTAVMNEVLRMAREREMVVSALMPFRATYYEHFGYGIVERKRNWTVPLDIVPAGDCSSIRYYRDEDRAALIACRQRIAQRNQCDIERSEAFWARYLAWAEDAFLVVDRADDGAVRGWMRLEHGHSDGLDTARVGWDWAWEDVATLKRFLSFLASLKDQYRFASMHMLADLPLNLLLTEKQMTHRASKNHPNAEMRQYTRMQVRVLDHKKFLEAMMLPPQSKGKAVVEVREPEGHASKFELDVADGKARVKPSDRTVDVICPAANWAMIACGDVKATLAAELGLTDVNQAKALDVLDVLAEGPKPYCREYF